MKTFLLFIFALVNAANGQILQCPGPYRPIGNGCYMFPDLGVSAWFDANIICQLSGGYLVKIDNEVEQVYLDAYHDEHYNGTLTDRWIGATDTLSDGTWRWVPSGETVEYNFWGEGEPVSNTASNCAFWSPDYDYWAANECCLNFPMSPLCEADPL